MQQIPPHTVDDQASNVRHASHAAILLGLAATMLTLFVELQLIRTVGGELPMRSERAQIVRSEDPSLTDAFGLTVEARPIQPDFHVDFASDR